MLDSHNPIFARLDAAGLQPVLSGHSAFFGRLTEHLLLLSRASGFLPNMTTGEIDLIAGLSVYHDIGKLSVPAAILSKPGRLSPEEYEFVKRHPAEGCRILESISELQFEPAFPLLYEICRHHHERIDGNGYPDHLQGDALAPYLQVIGLADAYDALVTDRPYKCAFSPGQAVQMIVSGTCGAFHPQLLKCFSAHASSVHRLTYPEVRDIA